MDFHAEEIFFHDAEIYFRVVEIDFHTVEIYFHGWALQVFVRLFLLWRYVYGNVGGTWQIEGIVNNTVGNVGGFERVFSDVHKINAVGWRRMV